MFAELFHTEKSHVRKLKVLDQVFLKPMQEWQILPADQVQLLFQNLEEMLDIHSRFNSSMKAKRKEDPLVGDIGDILLVMVREKEAEAAEKNKIKDLTRLVKFPGVSPFKRDVSFPNGTHCRLLNCTKSNCLLPFQFDGPDGDNFQRAAATFCARQQIALESLKERRRKDTKLSNFLTEAEGNPMCRRLQLKDMLPTVMQR